MFADFQIYIFALQMVFDCILFNFELNVIFSTKYMSAYWLQTQNSCQSNDVWKDVQVKSIIPSSGNMYVCILREI